MWKQGGAYSGKRCLQLFDRGPFIKSWENKTDLYIPGGEPRAGYGAREEVAARFASVPVPAEPGTCYQASAMVWYLNKKVGSVSEGGVHPVRIQFLDAQGTVLPTRTISDDTMSSGHPFVLPGWRMALTFPVLAPAGAKSVRVVVAMTHAQYNRNDGPLAFSLEDRGFVLVDNIALYRVPGHWPTLMEQPGIHKTLHTDAFRAAVQAGMVPYVASSPAHRPNSLRVESATERAGGILIAQPKADQAEELALLVENLLNSSP